MEIARKKELLTELVDRLCEERGEAAPAGLATEELWDAFRALVNTRPPSRCDEPWIGLQDELLQGLIQEMGISGIDQAEPSAIDPRIRLWRGDITTLKVGAIVNAANSQMLGCWVPGHFCIDNAIHTFAGVQLRGECARIMRAQGHEEPTGQAKITPAYNLPSKYVIHTVGPIALGCPTDEHRAELASSYRSCLDLAAEKGLESIAFCCVSTGVFGFPQEEAAAIAVRTVRSWLDSHEGKGGLGERDGFGDKDRDDFDSAGLKGGMTVVFNVFSAKDEAIYRQLLQ